MKKVFFSIIIFFGISSILPSCKQKTADDELAERMAKSESFKAVMEEGKRMANHTVQLPDTVLNKYKLLKSKLNSYQKDSKLSILQKRDSMLQLVKLLSRIDTGLINQARNVLPIYKSFNNEFPEFGKLPKEEQSLVFKKAAVLFKNITKLKKPKVKISIS